MDIIVIYGLDFGMEKISSLKGLGYRCKYENSGNLVSQIKDHFESDRKIGLSCILIWMKRVRSFIFRLGFLIMCYDIKESYKGCFN